MCSSKWSRMEREWSEKCVGTDVGKDISLRAVPVDSSSLFQGQLSQLA